MLSNANAKLMLSNANHKKIQALKLQFCKRKYAYTQTGQRPHRAQPLLKVITTAAV